MSREGDKGGGSWNHILITNNQILRKRVSECQLLHSVGWLSRGAGWYGFHDDDPSNDCIFRYFLNIHLLGSFFQGTKMRNPSDKYAVGASHGGSKPPPYEVSLSVLTEQ